MVLLVSEEVLELRCDCTREFEDDPFVLVTDEEGGFHYVHKTCGKIVACKLRGKMAALFGHCLLQLPK